MENYFILTKADSSQGLTDFFDNFNFYVIISQGMFESLFVRRALRKVGTAVGGPKGSKFEKT